MAPLEGTVVEVNLRYTLLEAAGKRILIPKFPAFYDSRHRRGTRTAPAHRDDRMKPVPSPVVPGGKDEPEVSRGW